MSSLLCIVWLKINHANFQSFILFYFQYKCTGTYCRSLFGILRLKCFHEKKNDWSMQNVVKLALTPYSTATKHDFEVYEKILMYKMFHWYVDCQESPFCFFQIFTNWVLKSMEIK